MQEDAASCAMRQKKVPNARGEESPVRTKQCPEVKVGEDTGHAPAHPEDGKR